VLEEGSLLFHCEIVARVLPRPPNDWHQRRAKRVRCMPGLGQGGLKKRRKLRRGLAGGTF
jgi:hypothetical protein